MAGKNTHLQTYVLLPRFCKRVRLRAASNALLLLQKDSLQVPLIGILKPQKMGGDVLAKDTDGTRYDKGFKLVNQIYEIDYCWYDRQADMTVSHETERYFFVDFTRRGKLP